MGFLRIACFVGCGKVAEVDMDMDKGVRMNGRHGRVSPLVERLMSQSTNKSGAIRDPI